MNNALQTIGVSGAGTPGSGIAQVCATAGFPVLLLDVDEACVARGRRSGRGFYSH